MRLGSWRRWNVGLWEDLMFRRWKWSRGCKFSRYFVIFLEYCLTFSWPISYVGPYLVEWYHILPISCWVISYFAPYLAFFLYWTIPTQILRFFMVKICQLRLALNRMHFTELLNPVLWLNTLPQLLNIILAQQYIIYISFWMCNRHVIML